jgi:hypothetical protein
VRLIALVSQLLLWENGMEEESKSEPFMFQLLRLCLEEDESSSPDGLSDKELYSTFAFIIIAIAFLALTIGPFSLMK